MSVVAIPITTDGQVGSGWGRAPRVAIAVVDGGAIATWDEHQVDWDRLHDEGTEGSHHARMVRFLQEHAVTHVVTGHIGDGMRNVMGRLGITVADGAAGDARAAVLAV